LGNCGSEVPPRRRDDLDLGRSNAFLLWIWFGKGECGTLRHAKHDPVYFDSVGARVSFSAICIRRDATAAVSAGDHSSAARSRHAFCLSKQIEAMLVVC
jgi:hypothetical protein